jgi:type II restriction/modification system DNA methylase subunit YeeA
VEAELAALRAAAEGALGGLAGAARIDRAQLLRRQISLRCLYGVDLNPLAVDLARLSLWIHSFVPGLPLALLDSHLVRGNALVGMGTVRQL